MGLPKNSAPGPLTRKIAIIVQDSNLDQPSIVDLPIETIFFLNDNVSTSKLY